MKNTVDMDDTDNADDELSARTNERIKEISRCYDRQHARMSRAIASMSQDQIKERLIGQCIELVLLRTVTRKIEFLSECRNELLHREELKRSEQSKQLGELAERMEEFRRHRIKGAEEKKRKDQKQAAKVSVHEFWREWKKGKHRKIKTVEQFAIEAMRRWPILKSPKVIGRWSATWSKEAKRGKESE